jgi:outer membrane receptor protein involved in Fe transport
LPWCNFNNVPGVSRTAGQCIVNGNDQRTTGAELEVTLVPVEGLTLGGNLSYNLSTISNIPKALLAPDGNYAPVFLPAWTGSLSAQYRGPDMDLLRGTHVTTRIDAAYTSNSFGSTPNSTRPVAIHAQIPSRTIVNGRLGLTGFVVGGADAERIRLLTRR